MRIVDGIEKCFIPIKNTNIKLQISLKSMIWVIII